MAGEAQEQRLDESDELPIVDIVSSADAELDVEQGVASSDNATGLRDVIMGDSDSSPSMKREESIMDTVRFRINQLQCGGESPAAGPSLRSRKFTAHTAMIAMTHDSANVSTEIIRRCFKTSFRAAVVGAILLTVLLSWGGMYAPLEYFTQTMSSRSIEALGSAIHSQQDRISPLAESKMSNRYKGVFDVMGITIDRFVLKPPKNAVDALWGHMRTAGEFGNGFTGRDDNRSRTSLAVAAFKEISYQWSGARATGVIVDTSPGENDVFRVPRTDSLCAIWDTEQFIGAQLDWAPLVGADGKYRHEVVSSEIHDAPAGTPGQPVEVASVNVSVATDYGFHALGTPSSWWTTPTTMAFYTSQQRIRDAAAESKSGGADVPAVRAWSQLFMYEHTRNVALAWTAPIADCGSYGCFRGAIAASIKLDSISWDCRQHWLHLQQSCDTPLDETNSGIFIVNKYSRNFPHQAGVLVGASSMNLANEPTGTTLTFADSSPQLLVRATYRAVVQHFRSLTNETLTDPSRSWMSYRLRGADEEDMHPFMNCEEGMPGGYAEDCLRVGLRTLYLDTEKDTEWLLIVVLPSNAFRRGIFETVTAASGALEEFTDSSKEKVAQISVAGFFLLIAMASGGIAFGLFIGCLVNRPLRRLSGLMQKLNNLDFKDETGELEHLSQGHFSSIRDVAKLQQAFCTLARGTEAFARFVPQTVVQHIVRGDVRATRLHVSRREVTIMFSVIEDAAALSETVSQSDFIFMLTRFFSVMTRIVERFEGVVGEIMTEPPGLLVFWNTPLAVEQHAAKACTAALAMHRAVGALNEEFEHGLLPDIGVRIGLHTGHVLTGNIGSETKMKFGCLGDPMNLASRLAGLCSTYGVGVLCSGETRAGLASSFFCRRLDLVKVKGRGEPTTIYEVIDQDFGQSAANIAGAAAAAALRRGAIGAPGSGRSPRGGWQWRTATRARLSRPDDEDGRKSSKNSGNSRNSRSRSPASNAESGARRARGGLAAGAFATTASIFSRHTAMSAVKSDKDSVDSAAAPSSPTSAGVFLRDLAIGISRRAMYSRRTGAAATDPNFDLFEPGRPTASFVNSLDERRGEGVYTAKDAVDDAMRESEEAIKRKSTAIFLWSRMRSWGNGSVGQNGSADDAASPNADSRSPAATNSMGSYFSTLLSSRGQGQGVGPVLEEKPGPKLVPPAPTLSRPKRVGSRGLSSLAFASYQQDSICPGARAYVQKYEAALDAYQNAAFAEAYSQAKELLSEQPGDVSASLLCRRSRGHLDPDGKSIALSAEELAAWTGVVELSKK